MSAANARPTGSFGAPLAQLTSQQHSSRRKFLVSTVPEFVPPPRHPAPTSDHHTTNMRENHHPTSNPFPAASPSPERLPLSPNFQSPAPIGSSPSCASVENQSREE